MHYKCTKIVIKDKQGIKILLITLKNLLKLNENFNLPCLDDPISKCKINGGVERLRELTEDSDDKVNQMASNILNKYFSPQDESEIEMEIDQENEGESENEDGEFLIIT